MKRLITVLVSVFAVSTFAASPFFSAFNNPVRAMFEGQRRVVVNGLEIRVPSGWEIKQSALDNGTTILRLSNGVEHVSFFSKEGNAVDIREMVGTGVIVLEESALLTKNLRWDTISVENSAPETISNYSFAFATELGGYSFYGYATGSQSALALEAAQTFLNNVKPNSHRSLTGPDYKGKKYYLGFGAAMSFDPLMMQNEVMYDVLHTHDIFTKEVGGNYIGTKFTSYKDATKANITARWAELKNLIQPDDMYVQYSSGHGSQTGLAVGVQYQQIRDMALSFNAKETVIFIMACHSGGLVNSFNSVKDQWQDYPSQGKTLFVMASSSVSQTSSTGPKTDPEEPAGTVGSAGSAFGHALWKALIGHADGASDGMKDGYLSLDEIQKFATTKTKQVGGHTPVWTGAYDGKLIMNRIPPKEFLASLERSTEGLSNEEIAQQVQDLDRILRIRQ